MSRGPRRAMDGPDHIAFDTVLTLTDQNGWQRAYGPFAAHTSQKER